MIGQESAWKKRKENQKHCPVASFSDYDKMLKNGGRVNMTQAELDKLINDKYLEYHKKERTLNG